MIYITSLIPTKQTDEVVLGVSRTLAGAVRVVQESIGNAFSFRIAETTPSRTLLINEERCFCVMIRQHDLEIESGKAYIVTRKYPGKVYETIWGISPGPFDHVESIIHRMVEDPVFTEYPHCHMVKVEGQTPFHKILGDENPELNRVCYFIYERDIYDVKRELAKGVDMDDKICSDSETSGNS